MKSTFISIALSTVMLATVGCGGGGDPEAERIAKLRHDNFEKIGGAFKTIRDEFKESPADMAKISGAAQTIAGLAKEVPSWFPAGSGPDSGVDTEALPSIWEKPTEFQAAADQFVSASDAFAAAAASGDAQATMGEIRNLGGACKNCHDNFREEDE
ncbi:c-type cytochrome [Aurantivibrio plasticivorans]